MFTSCSDADQKEKVIKKQKQYVFLGHIYEEVNTVDPRIENLDLSKYDQIWLGGDVCAETTKDEATLEYLDQLFDLDAPTTHWTLGNHDVRNGNIDYITDATDRETFYTTSMDGITIMVLNTVQQEEDVLNEQFEMMRDVCDTIEKSSHLVVLSHSTFMHRIDSTIWICDSSNVDAGWMYGRMNPDKKLIWTVSQQLWKAQKRGVQVVVVFGDFGHKSNGYDKRMMNGIHLLGSGITSNTEYNERFPTNGRNDYILLFNHDLEKRELSWNFQKLD